MPSLQCPLDLWVYQELIYRTRADTVVEVGVKAGGTTLFCADVFESLYRDDVDTGVVVGVDISLKSVDPRVPEHRRVRLIRGDSSAGETLQHVRAAIGVNPIVILDSNHSRAHVLDELRLYSELVRPGGYMIVNDTNIAGHPVLSWKEDGPHEAVADFLADDRRFVVDASCEKHMLTQSPGGFLLRRDPS